MDLLAEKIQMALKDYRAGKILAVHVCRIADALCHDRTGAFMLQKSGLEWEGPADLREWPQGEKGPY